MMHIELPRALEDYFAYAETDPTRNGRRFTISMPYFEGDRLDRLQWWYHLTRDQEQRLGAGIVDSMRAQATDRFRKHIERWLQNTGQRLHGQEPIPRISPLPKPAAATASVGNTTTTAAMASAATTANAATSTTRSGAVAPSATAASGTAPGTAPSAGELPAETTPATVLPWPAEKVANG